MSCIQAQGWGGHCIAVDPWFIVSQNPQKSALIKQARLINNHKPLSIVQDVIKSYSAKRDGILDKDYKIGLFGLSYKPDIDDLRESPSVIMANKLVEEFPDQKFMLWGKPHINSNHEVFKFWVTFDFTRKSVF